MRKFIPIYILLLACLTGCSNNIFTYNTGKENIKEVKTIQKEELELNNLYIKNDEGYLKASDEFNLNFSSVSSTANSSRIIYYIDDEDMLIPTMYKNDELLFYTSENVPTTFYFERFEDEGYSIGVMQLGINSANKCIAPVNLKTFIENSSFGQHVNEIVPFESKQAKNTNIIINKINSTPITFNSLSVGGTLTGFIMGNTYSVEYYIGSLQVTEDIVADTHFFTSFEMEETNKYELEEDFVKFDMSNCESGYYMINGYGFIRYVNADRGADISKINFNAPRQENIYDTISTTATPIDGQESEE